MAAWSQAWRALARRPAFSLIAVLTLAVSAGVTGAVFDIVHGVLWTPLPYPDADRLVAVYEANPGQEQRVSLVAPPRLEDWRRLSRAFVAISGSYAESITDTSGTEPERLDGRRVVPGFFDVFRVAPLAGRTFAADEERFGGAATAVISEGFWTRRFSRRPDAIGARLLAGGTAYTIVGVMPRSFAAATDVWLPAQLSPGLMRVREARFLTGIGRMRVGVSIAEARADLARVERQLGEQYPASDAGWSADVRDLKDVRVGEYRRPLVLVLAAVSLLFLIAAANVAGLVLVQLHRRATELAVRAALGGSRRRIASAVARELVIVAAAAAAGATVITVALATLARGAFTAVPRVGDVRVSAVTLAFIIVSLVVGAVLFGLLPVAAVLRGPVSPLVAAGGRSVAGGRHRLQHAMVVAQLALGVLLAGSAGLLARSYAAMAAVDMGFDPRHVLTFHVGAAWDDDRARIGQLQDRLVAELRRAPGVREAGFANFLPATGATLRFQVRVDGLASAEPNGAFTVGQRTVTPGYLRALSYPLAGGAWCEESRADFGVDRVRDAMVNRAFVDRFARGANLIGRTLTFVQQGSQAFRIVGVVGDALEDGPSAPSYPYVYACLAEGAWPDPEYVVRAEGDPRMLSAAVRRIVRSLDPSRPIFAVKPVQDVLDASLDQPRLNARAVTAFAAAALLLAGLGLYGVMTLVVGERRRDLGVRIALGASAAEVTRLVAAAAARLVAAGLAVGFVLTLAAGPLLRSLLFGVGAFDPWALAMAAASLTMAALAAVAAPVRHALSMSAIEAMRVE
jgi:predicted permease